MLTKKEHPSKDPMLRSPRKEHPKKQFKVMLTIKEHPNNDPML